MTQQDTKINKARHNSTKTPDDYLLLTIEGNLKQIGEEINGVYSSYTFIIKNQEYSFDTCLDSDRSDKFANLLLKVYRLLASGNSNYKINDKPQHYEKLFFCKIMELYNSRESYSYIYKKDVHNLYYNFCNLSSHQPITNITNIELPSAEILTKHELELIQISDTEYGFDIDIQIPIFEPQHVLKNGIKMHEGNYHFIQSWGLDDSVLYVEFKNGRLYKYKDLDEFTIGSIQIARNFERTFQKHIKDHFECECIEK